jgi:uncharacterized protein with PIN domain
MIAAGPHSSSKRSRRKTARVRFYAELNDFLPANKRQRAFEYEFSGSPSVKDAIEAIGVPHPEVDLVIINGHSVDFRCRLTAGDDVAVYPVFEGLDISPIVHLRGRPLRQTRFVADGHLGKLARYLRLLGFDVSYDASADDSSIVRAAQAERRIILTRDQQMLKVGAVTHGYWVRGTMPREQIAEVIGRFDLKGSARPFTRCLVCNGTLELAANPAGAPGVPDRVRRRHTEFARCADCGKLYWKGTHYARLERLVTELIRG